MNPSTQTDHTKQRQNWISVIALADFADLDHHWRALEIKPVFNTIRPAEVGLSQVQARMGATGRKFNMGDVTISRAVVQLETGEMGYSYVKGRNKQHASLAALIDALMQTDIHKEVLNNMLIQPLAAIKAELETSRAQAVSSSKVDFFTLVRGED